MADVVRTELVGGVAMVTVEAPPLNLLGLEVRQGLFGAIAAAGDDDAVVGVVIRCAGRSFCAGFDITEFGRPLVSPTLRELVDLIEASGKPIVAAMHGTALGGGLELAMACHGRVAAPGTRLGLVEVKLGLLPGCGGTQRLPRLVDFALAARMTAIGQTLHAHRALAEGLVDVVSDDLRGAGVALVHALRERPAQPTSRRPVRADDTARQAVQDLLLAVKRGAPDCKAPVNCIRAVQAALDGDFEQGLEREWTLFCDLLDDSQRLAQFHLFFAERALVRPFKGSADRWQVRAETGVPWLDDFITLQAAAAGAAVDRALDPQTALQLADGLADSALAPGDLAQLAVTERTGSEPPSLRVFLAEPTRPDLALPVAGARASVRVRCEAEGLGHCEAMLHIRSQPAARRLAEVRMAKPTSPSAAEQAIAGFFCASGWLVVPVAEHAQPWPSEHLSISPTVAAELVHAGSIGDAAACNVLATVAADFPRHLGGPLYSA